jgi:FKBP-type peptidyl-prolyl cis-trans isomerase SlyD
MTRNVVTFHYTLRDPSGQVLDLSAGGEPISYLEGAGQIIDGLDEQLRGVAVGTKTRVVVPAEKAYGLPDAERIHKVNRSLIPFEGDLKVGDRFQTEPDPGSPVVTIAAVEGDEVTLDANHPLAGVDLTFDVEILAVRAATAEELAHGHAHGPAAGGCGCGKGECSSEG